MELTFLGKTSFKLRTKNITLVINPLNTKERADVVVITGGGEGTKNIAGGASREDVFVIDKEGEYELGGVGVVAQKVGERMLVLINGDGVEVAHVGMSSKDMTDKQAGKLQETDVLLVPISSAVESIEAVEPYVAVLMGYDDQVQVDDFLAKHKYEVVKRGLSKLKLEAGDLPENTEVVVLDA